VVRAGYDGRDHRLTTLAAGGTFGELALLDRRARAADVRADSAVVCRTLRYETLDRLAVSDPALHAKLIRNLFGVVVATLHGVNAEIAHLTR
jgi:glutaminase